jgi:hypothetical protein
LPLILSCLSLKLTSENSVMERFSLKSKKMYAVRTSFVVQPTCTPVNDNLMELVIMVDAMRSGFGKAHYRCFTLLRLCPTGPQGGPKGTDFCKGGRRNVDGCWVFAEYCVWTLHAGQIQGFFNIPVDHLYAAPVLMRHIQRNLTILLWYHLMPAVSNEPGPLPNDSIAAWQL